MPIWGVFLKPQTFGPAHLLEFLATLLPHCGRAEAGIGRGAIHHIEKDLSEEDTGGSGTGQATFRDCARAIFRDFRSQFDRTELVR